MILTGSLLFLSLFCFTTLYSFFVKKQNALIYKNHSPGDSTASYDYLPSRYNLPYEDVWIQTKDGILLHGWLIRYKHPSSSGQHKCEYTRNSSSLSSLSSSRSFTTLIGDPEKEQNPNTSLPVVIYFHGNGGNISHRLLFIKYMFDAMVQCNVLLVEYRGYGKSEGKPSEIGLQYDADAALDYILSREDLNRMQIFVFGRSLGAAVALHLVSNRLQGFEKQNKHRLQATKKRQEESMNKRREEEVVEEKEHHEDTCGVKGLILENTFTSIDDLIDLKYPYLKFFKFLSFNKWKNIDRIQMLPKDFPVLFISGLRDQMIPPNMMQQLYDKCKSEKKMMQMFENGDHANTWKQFNYFSTLKEFFSLCRDQ